MSSRVTIIGGGIASLLLGVELRRLRPDLSVELITQEKSERAGGHLASWTEGGYPVEHGFHALFSCYHTAKQLLAQHGLLSQFVPGPEHFFLFRDSQLARAGNGLQSFLPPLRVGEVLDGLPGLPGAISAMLSALRGDDTRLAALDKQDLRDALLKMGAGSRVVESPATRLFYGVGFVGDEQLSAAVGFSLMSQLFLGGQMLHFPGPSRETLIEPLRTRFRAMGGVLTEQTRLASIKYEQHRVVEIELLHEGRSATKKIDELVLALDVESFKKIMWRAEVPSFVPGVQRLRGVVSLSLQAWFEEDPVPPEIDSVLGGLPEPWSTICPVTRVRKQGRGPHGFELIGCGPESGLEDVPDAALIARFFDTLRRVGFRLPEDMSRVHVVIRRNRETSERYLGTFPNELSLRPLPREAGVKNLSLVGAWLRVPFSIPSVEAVSQSVVIVRDALCAKPARTRPLP